nr:MAG TPA: hypothetical protein [Caudoviricetes sp.]
MPYNLPFFKVLTYCEALYKLQTKHNPINHI